MAETVLVTGGSGYVGSWCVSVALARGYTVRTTVRSTAKGSALVESLAKGGSPTGHLSPVIADLTGDGGWAAAMEGCDFVLHVASPLGGATGRDALIGPARDGTLRVLRAANAAGVKRVVMTSAAAAARAPHKATQVSDETIWADPDDGQFDAYRRSKILAEQAAWDFVKDQPRCTELATILPGAVFGPLLLRENLGSVQIINRLLRGTPSAMPKIGFWIVDVRTWPTRISRQ